MKLNIPREWIAQKAKEEVESGSDCTAGDPRFLLNRSRRYSRFATLIWKARYTLEMWRVARMPLRFGWDSAGAWVEMVNGDLSDATPAEAVAEEISRWEDG